MQIKIEFYGNIRKDHFGNIILDDCESDQDHLVNATTAPSLNKPYCRFSLNNLLDGITGKRGTLILNGEFTEE